MHTHRYGGDAPTAADCKALVDLLRVLGAKRMVIGHTVRKDGISPACGDAVWRVDVGLSGAYAMGKRAQSQALEINPGGVVKVLISS